MCKMASFIFGPTEAMPVRTWALTDHSATRDHYRARDDASRGAWREGHYLPSGEVSCRVLDTDSITSAQAEACVRARWPRFADFLTWALAEGWDGGGLHLGGLTSAEGLTLPQSVGGSLYLGRLTSAKGLTLPKSIGGWLDLSGLTSTEKARVTRRR